MKKLIGLGTTAALSLIVAGATFGHDGNGRHGGCSNRTIKGTYGIQMHGTRPVPGGTGVETVIGLVTRTYDGAGKFTQVDNVKGSVSGIVPNRAGAGTYVVNADCTGTTLFQPGPGIAIEERIVIVDFGQEVFSITVSPQPLMVETIAKRIGWR
jgi:hypothetical protein